MGATISGAELLREWTVIRARLRLALIEAESLRVADKDLDAANERLRRRLQDWSHQLKPCGGAASSLLGRFPPAGMRSLGDVHHFEDAVMEELSLVATDRELPALHGSIDHELLKIIRPLRATAALSQIRDMLKTSAEAVGTSLPPGVGAGEFGRLLAMSVDAWWDGEGFTLLSGVVKRCVDGLGEHALRERIRALDRLRSTPHISQIVIVEDDPYWIQLIQLAVFDHYLEPGLELPDLVWCGSQEEALRVLDQLDRSGDLGSTILVCDLAIPEDRLGPTDINLGMAVVEGYVGRCEIVVLTSRASLFEVFHALSGSGVDFVAKGGTDEDPYEWAEDLSSRLRLLLCFPMEEARLEVLGFSGTTVVFNGVEVALEPADFALIEALAAGRPCDFVPPGRDDAPSSLGMRAEALAARMTLQGLTSLEGLGYSTHPTTAVLAAAEHCRDHLARVQQAVERSLRGAGMPIPQGKLGELFISGAPDQVVLRDHADLIRQDDEAQGVEAVDMALAEMVHGGAEVVVRLTPTRTRLVRSGMDAAGWLKRREGRLDGDAVSGRPCYSVLVVEDDGSYRRGLVDDLADDFARADAATDLSEARELLRHHDYDLVVLDLCIPASVGGQPSQQLGIDLGRELIGLPTTTDVVVFSAYASADLRAHLRRAEGALDRAPAKCSPGPIRSVVLKSGDIESDLARVRIEVDRAYAGFCRSARVNLSDAEHTHVIGLRRDPDGECAFEVDGEPITPAGRPQSQDALHARQLVSYLASYPNLFIHRHIIASDLVISGQWPATSGDLGQLLTRALAAARKGVKAVGIDPDEVLAKRGRDSHALLGIVKYGGQVP